MSKETKPCSRKENIVVQDVDGEVLIYDLERNKALCLNRTSALVWMACDGKRTVAEINDSLAHSLQTQTDEDMVWLALDQLSRENLIDEAVDVGSKFEGLTRREVIRKIGLGSMVALPVVASLVAPKAAFAQTCTAPLNRPDFDACDQSCQCLNGCCCIVAAATLCLTMADCTSAGGTCATF